MPFLNRPAAEFWATSVGKALLTRAASGDVHTLHFTRGAKVPGPPPAEPVRVWMNHRPLLDFRSYVRQGAQKLLAGPGRIFTVYQIDGIRNESGQPYAFAPTDL